jgi:ribosomal protein S18 acetylase RimI-like enzyme
MVRNTGEVRVRRMAPSDLNKVNQIDRLLSGSERVPTWPFSFEAYWNIYGPGQIFVADIDSQVVGFIAGNITQEDRSFSVLDMMRTTQPPSRYPKVGWIDMLGVLPDFQSKHVGAALVDAFYKECKSISATMRIIVKKDDARLTSFLERIGFKKWEITTYEKE